LFWVHFIQLKFVILIFPIFFSLNSYTQQIVIHDTTYLSEYKISKATTSNPLLISFLDKLANVTQVGDPFFYIDLATTLTTTKVSSNQYQVSCVVDKREIRGNYLWNGFDLTPSLFPSQYQAVIEINNNGKTISHPIVGSLINKQTLLTPISIDSAQREPNAKLKDIRIEFDKQWQNEILFQIAAIEAYQKSDSIFARWDTISKKINLQKTELIPLYDFEMDALMNEIKAITELNIIHRLKLNENDPKQFAPKLTNINISISQKQLILNEYLMNIDQRFILDARKLKEQGNILQSIVSFNKALEYHSFNIIALLELSKLHYEIGNIEDASRLTKRLISTTYPDDKLLEEVTNATIRLYRKIVNQGNDMLVAQKFAEAQSIFEKANIFCDSIDNSSFCNGDHSKGIVAAKTGIYKSYITIIKKALNNNFTSIAENYIKEAQKYQQLNKKELPSDAELQLCVNELVNKLLNTSTKQLQAKQFVNALSSLEKADSIGHMFRPDFNLSNLTDYRKRAAQGGFDELISQTNRHALQFDQYMAEKSFQQVISFKEKYQLYIVDTTSLKITLRNIKNIDYSNAINIGNQLSRLQMNQNALDKYLFAKSLEIKYQIPQTTNLDSLIQSLSKPLTIEYLSKCRQNIWGNDFQKATELINKVDSLSNTSLLNNDSLIVLDIKNTKAFLEKQLCAYQNIRYNEFSDTYNHSLKEKNFAMAANVIDSMNIITINYTNCVKKINISNNEKIQIQQLSSYQKWIKDARYYLAINKVPEALIQYYKADSLYKNKIVSSTMVGYDSISTIFILIDNKKNLIESCNWLFNNEKPMDAFTLLLIMKQKGVSAKETSNVQKLIAKSLYKIDRKKYPTISKKELLKMYQIKGSWFYSFRNGYLNNPITSVM